MPSPTYTLIASTTLTSNTSVVTFSSIPQTYTDLVLKCSIRGTQQFNSSILEGTWFQTNDGNPDYSYTMLTGNGTAAASSRYTTATNGYWIGANNTASGNSATANTFGNVEIYIPNYTTSNKKVSSIFGVGENNGSSAGIGTSAGLINFTSAIDTLYIGAGNNLDNDGVLSGSTFYLYGIKSS